MFNAAVIGLGKIGLQFDIPRKAMPQSHALAYHLNPDINLVAGVGVRQEQGDRLAEVAPEAKFYLDLGEMLSRHRLDIVSICTPPHVRLDLLRTVMEGSDASVIFLEKPVANTTREAEAIVALAERHNRTVLVNLSRRWSYGAVRVREAIRSGRYGRLKTVHLKYTRGISNTGSHLFDLVRFIAGPVESVQVLRRVPTRLDALDDPTYSFAFTLESGEATGYAEGFDDRDYVLFELDLFLEKGRIEIRQGGDEIRFYGVEEHPVQQGLTQLALQEEETRLSGRSSSISNAAAHLVEVLQGRSKPISTLEDGIYPLYAAEALRRSNAAGGSLVRIVKGGSQS